ncbi:MAG: hypothetical protein HFJ08_19020 [Lachnospiraceae bacterium]|nr:hypothetical protein [Lachnospiraceae bacterium]
MKKKIKAEITLILIPLILILFLGLPYIKKKYTIYCAIKAYNEFLDGKRSCANEDIFSLITPTREPERRYLTDYYIVDITGDGIPELYVQGHINIIFTFRDGDMRSLDNTGKEVDKLSFMWRDTNNNIAFDNDDTYEFNGEKCTMQEWFEKTKGYIYIDEKGVDQLCNEADWIRYCEAK